MTKRPLIVILLFLDIFLEIIYDYIHQLKRGVAKADLTARVKSSVQGINPRFYPQRCHFAGQTFIPVLNADGGKGLFTFF